MKKIIVISLIALTLFTSCARSVSVFDAANGRARCGQWLKG